MLSGFDHSTVMARPWAKAGIRCYCVDLDHPPGETVDGNIIRVGADIRKWNPPAGVTWVFAAFFTPCTHMAASGARWWAGKGLRKLAEAIELVAVSSEMAESLGCPYLIENPIGALSTHWRKPDHKFDPCDYGDPYTKRTCLWTGGGFRMPPKCRVTPTEGSKMHVIPPSADRARKRSVTPSGFAQAVFLANQFNQ